MSNCRRCLFGALIVLGALASQGVAAQSPYYLGVEMGRENLSFKPEYSFVSGVPNSTFDNQADGSIGSIVTGYHWKSGKILSLDLQGRLSVNSNSWQMALPEPASFRYDLPLNLAVSLLPSFHLSEKFAVFAEAGLALGKIREQKTAATTSRYDVEKWRPGIVAGFGLRLALDERWSVHAGYRRTWYQDHEFATYLANGTQVETVISRVVQSTSTMVLVREF